MILDYTVNVTCKSTRFSLVTVYDLNPAHFSQGPEQGTRATRVIYTPSPLLKSIESVTSVSIKLSSTVAPEEPQQPNDC